MALDAWFAYFLLVLSTLVIHEIGHWSQMVRVGIRVEKMTLGMGPSRRIFKKGYLALFPIGASVAPNPDDWHAATPFNRFMVAIAGPIASFCCGAVMLALAAFYPSLRGLTYIADMHFLLGMVNLVPVPPLDGWVALSELFNIRHRPLSNAFLSWAARLGNGLIYGFGFWFIGHFVFGGN